HLMFRTRPGLHQPNSRSSRSSSSGGGKCDADPEFFWEMSAVGGGKPDKEMFGVVLAKMVLKSTLALIPLSLAKESGQKIGLGVRFVGAEKHSGSAKPDCHALVRSGPCSRAARRGRHHRPASASRAVRRSDPPLLAGGRARSRRCR